MWTNVKRMVQLEPKPLPVVPAALKAQASSDAAGPERVPGAGAEAAATSDWVTRVVPDAAKGQSEPAASRSVGRVSNRVVRNQRPVDRAVLRLSPRMRS